MQSHVEFCAARNRNEREAAPAIISVPQMRGEKNSVASLSIPRAIGGHLEKLIREEGKNMKTREIRYSSNGVPRTWTITRCGTK